MRPTRLLRRHQSLKRLPPQQPPIPRLELRSLRLNCRAPTSLLTTPTAMRGCGILTVSAVTTHSHPAHCAWGGRSSTIGPTLPAAHSFGAAEHHGRSAALQWQEARLQGSGPTAHHHVAGPLPILLNRLQLRRSLSRLVPGLNLAAFSEQRRASAREIASLPRSSLTTGIERLSR
jgi:hypothetical protein